MKIKVLGNELIDPEIDMISLVKRGANQAPFKIMKAEDADPSVISRLRETFGHTDAAKVAALFVRQDAVSQVEPILKSEGWTTTSSHKAGEFTYYPQVDGELEVGTIMPLDKDVAVGFDRMIKEFAPFPESTDFNENQKSSAFLPNVHQSMDALAGTIWNVLQSAQTPDDASEGITKAVGAFAKHMKGLVGSLPQSVFKTELGLRERLARSTVSGEEPTSRVEKTDMSQENLKEVVGGDLAGLNEEIRKDEEPDTKAEAEVKEDEPEDSVQKGKRKMKKGDEIIEREYEFEMDGEDEIFLRWCDEEVAKDEEVKAEPEKKEEIKDEEKDEDEDNIKKEADASEITALTAAVTKLTEVVTSQQEELAAVKKTADVAKSKAENTVVVNPLGDVDESLGVHSRAVREVRKADNSEALWEGSSLDRITSEF